MCSEFNRGTRVWIVPVVLELRGKQWRAGRLHTTEDVKSAATSAAGVVVAPVPEPGISNAGAANMQPGRSHSWFQATWHVVCKTSRLLHSAGKAGSFDKSFRKDLDR